MSRHDTKASSVAAAPAGVDIDLDDKLEGWVVVMESSTREHVLDLGAAATKAYQGEVWRAAKERRTSNLLGAVALLPDGRPGECTRTLISVLQFTEVVDALSLGLTSQAFAAALLATGAAGIPRGGEGLAAELWQKLGAAESVAGEGQVGSAPPFSSDPAFRIAVWARRRSFVARIAHGIAKPMLISAAVPELATTVTELGPFLSGDGAERTLTGAAPERLLVCDGRQTFHVVDVKRLRGEEVADCKARQRLLRTSLGVHPTVVTASWPAGPEERCSVPGGVVVARAAQKRGTLPRETSSLAFQWLELPRFEAPSEALVEQVAAPAATGKPDSTPASSTLTPSSKPAAKTAAAKPTPKAATVKALTTKPTAASGSSAPLQRTSVPQERVAKLLAADLAAKGLPATEASSVLVEAVWPLPWDRMLLLVFEGGHGGVAAGLLPVPSPQLRNARSPQLTPALGPKANELLSCSAGSPAMRPGKSPQMSPGAGPTSKGSPQGQPGKRSPNLGAAFELPPGQASGRDDESGRPHLQVWELQSATSVSAGKGPEPVASALLTSAVTSVDASSSAEGPGLLLCGLASGGAELFGLPPRRPDGADQSPCQQAAVHASWPGEESEGAALHVLLRSAAGCSYAVVAQAGRVVAHPLPADGSSTGAGSTTMLLPAENFARNLNVVALRPIGCTGFAVCGEQHVYAFEAAQSDAPVLVSVVELPAVTPPEGLVGPAVWSFVPSPYEFFVVLDSAAVTGSERNAFCVVWPQLGHLQDVDAEENAAWNSRCKVRSMLLKSWVRKEGQATFARAVAPAVCVNDACFGSAGSPALSTLALDVQANDGAAGGLLAAAAPGPGVAVFAWGVEANPELEKLRDQRRQQLAEEARQREVDSMRRQLQRLTQKLQETDRLEEKLRENGSEALSEAEMAKLQRRFQVEQECARIFAEIGPEPEKEPEAAPARERRSGDSDDSDLYSDDEILPLGTVKTAAGAPEDPAVTRRREKEKCQKEHHTHKKVMQKERRACREQKYED